MTIRVVDLLEIVQVQRKHGQRINHREVAKNKRMILLFKELPTQTFDEKFLINRVDIEQYDQRDQAKNGFGKFDFEECFRAGQNCRKRERDHSKGKEKNDEDGIAAHPPVAPVNAPAFCCQFLRASLRGGGQRVEVSRVVHSFSTGGVGQTQSIQLSAGVHEDQGAFRLTSPGSYCPARDKLPTSSPDAET